MIRIDTTRPPKSEEQDGVDYHFVSEKNFRRDIKDNKYLEWGRFQGNYYGTKASAVKDVINSGKMVVLDLIPEVGNKSHFSQNLIKRTLYSSIF